MVDFLQIARDTYRDSTDYLDNELRSRWNKSLRQWQGKHPAKSKYDNKDYGKSRLFRPKTRSVIRKNEASAALAYLSSQDVVSIRASDDSNDLDRLTSEIANELLNHRLTKTIPWFHTVIGAYQAAQIYGQAISYQYWDKEKDEPCIELIPPENFRVSPSSDWINPIKSSPYIIHLMPMYAIDVKSQWPETTDGEMIASNNETNDSTRLARESIDSKDRKYSTIEDYTIVWVRRYIVKIQGIDFIYHTLGDQKLLDTPATLDTVYHHGYRPYVVGSCVIETFRPFSSGIPELISDVQKEINNIANQRLDNVKLAMDKRYFVKRNAQVDLRSITRNIAGSVTLMNEPSSDVIVHSTPDVTASSFQEQDRLNLDFDDLAGAFSGATVQANRRLNETVGGMQMLSSGANQIAEYQLKTFNETWVEPVLRQLVDLELMYETDETLLKIAGNNSKTFRQYGYQIVTDEMMQGDFVLNVNVGTGAAQPETQLKSFFFGLQSLSGINPQLVSMLNNEEIIKEAFSKLGYKDGKRFFNLDGNQEVTLLQAQIKELQDKLKDKEADKELKEAQTVKTLTEAQYSAMQGAATVAQIPAVAPIADIIMQNAGYEAPEGETSNPNYPMINQNQAVPDMPASSNIGAYHGIETNRVEDNVE